MVPSKQAIDEALTGLQGDALLGGLEYPVFTRVAEADGAMYLFLANDKGEAVEVTAAGWRVVTDPPVKFVRKKGKRG